MGKPYLVREHGRTKYGKTIFPHDAREAEDMETQRQTQVGAGGASGQAARATVPETMRAVVQQGYGEVDVWRLDRVARPQVADNEVLIQVRAAGLDRGTWHMMSGRPYLMRVIGFGFRSPKNPVPGLDVAGTVVAVGRASRSSRPATRSSASPRARSPSTPPRWRASSPSSPPT
jgi:hypothetical protein